MLVVDQGPPRCETWTVDPDHHRLTHTNSTAGATTTRVLELHAEGKQLVFDGFSTETGEEASSTTCSTKLEARETDTAIIGDRLHWFRDGAACAAALKDHTALATSLDCKLDVEVPAQVQRKARLRFEKLLAQGGVVHTIVEGPRGDTCRPVRVRHYGARGVLEGAFEYDEVRDDGVRGVTSLDYQMQPGGEQIVLLGPGTTWRDGSGSALGCGNEAQVQLGDGFVTLAEPLYFSAAACRAAITTAAARERWFPAPAGDDEVATGPSSLGTPNLGGC